jgi:signal transduction histidine kinase
MWITQLHRYLTAVLMVAATGIVRFLFHELFQVQLYPFVLFVLPMTLAAWFYGRGPGLAAIGLSVILILYFFNPGVWPYAVGGSSGYLSIGIFIIEGSIIAFFAALKREIQKTKDTLSIGLEERDLERREQLRVAAQDLDAATKRLQEFKALSIMGTATARIAHEIANPLNGMFTTAQLLERFLHRGENDRALSAVRDLKEEVNSLKSLLDELREFSRPMTSPLNVGPVNLVALINEVLSAQAINGQQIQVERQISEDLPPVLGDTEKLKGALLNLTKNAIEAMPNGGKLIVRGYVQEKAVCIEIKDTGVGIPQGMKVFEPFITSKNSGWGLGLPNVLHAVSAHGGKIDYVSELGSGTTFKVCLPAAN